MKEKTLFKLARAITDTGTDTVSSKGGTVTYRITSIKRNLVNGKVVSTSTPSCTLGSASVSWTTWGGVTVGDGYLDVKINYSENTGSSRSTTLTFDQDGSGNKINLTVTQESGITYTGYMKVLVNSLPLGGGKGNTAQIIMIACLKGSDGSRKPEPPHVGSAPDWCSVSITQSSNPENHYLLTLTALSSNNTGADRSEHLFLTCGDANLSIPVTQRSTRKSTFTLLGLTPKSNYFLFASGHFPLSNTPFQYLMIMGDSEITLSIPCPVNMSDPEQKSEANTGDRVSVCQYDNDHFVSAGSFTVPAAGGTTSV